MRFCLVCQQCYDDLVYSCSNEDHPALSETRFSDREVVPGYRADVVLETGPRGDLFRAEHIASGQSCLVRVLPVSNSDSGAFLREAQIVATLFHPNVADIYESGTLNSGELFVVSEDTTGRSLRVLLDSSGVPDLLTTVRALRQVGEALHAIHLKGLVHRALSPENIIFGSDAYGRMQVRIRNIDFGGVIERSVVSNKFMIDSAIDLLRYFSPEQCLAESVGIKSDIYSLGVVLYEMLSGRPPFDALKATELIQMHKNQRPPEIKIDDFELRMLLTHTLMESLRKRPEKRQSSANAFARQLRHIEQLATHVSTPPPAGVVPPIPKRSSARAKVAVVSEPSMKVPAPEPVMIHSLQQAGPEAESPLIVLEAAVEDLPAAPDVISEQPSTGILTEECMVHVHQRLSRLKIRRKRSQPKSDPAVPAGSELKPLTVVDPKPATPTPPPTPQAAKVEVPAQPAVMAAAAGRSAAKVVWEQPDDDIPSMADVLEELSKEPQIQPAVQRQETKAATRPQVVTAAPKEEKRVPVTRREPEEITIVTARTRPTIRVPVERPKPPRQRPPAQAVLRQGSAETMFFPTLLGGSLQKGGAVLPNTIGSTLSDFMPISMPEISVSSRSLMIGGGVLTLMVVLLFGISLRKQEPASSGQDSITARSETEQQVPTQPVRTESVTPSVKNPVRSFEKTENAAPEPEGSRASSNKAVVPPSADKTQPMPSRNGTKTSPAVPARAASGNLPAKGKSEPGKKAADKRPNAGQNKPTGTTRPRIVKNPKP